MMDDQDQANDEQPRPRTKAELLEKMEHGREALERMLATMTPEQLVAPVTQGDWSTKDHLGHLVAWHEVVLGALAGRPEHEVAELDEATYRDLDIDEQNDVFFRRYRDLPYPEVLAAFRRTYQAIVDAIRPLDDT